MRCHDPVRWINDDSDDDTVTFAFDAYFAVGLPATVRSRIVGDVQDCLNDHIGGPKWRKMAFRWVAISNHMPTTRPVAVKNMPRTSA